MASFDEAFKHVIVAEGGDKYTNDPFDHGGPTKYGITQSTLASYRGKPVFEADVKNLTEHEAKMIYRAKYWNPLACDKIRSQIMAMILFDQGVNKGIVAASKTIQSVVGAKVDGMIGPRTLELINSKLDRDVAFQFVCRAQEEYARIVQKDHTQSRFLVGWLRRTHKLFEMVMRA